MAEEGNFRDKLIRAFGLEDIDEEDYEEEVDEAYYPEEEALNNRTVISNESSTVTTNTIPNSNPVPEKVPDVLVLDPTSFDEAPGIVNRLKQDRTIVVNLKSIDYEEGRHIFDFLSGAVYALEGSLNRIDESVFILAPKLISVGTKIENPSNNINTSSTTTTNLPSWENN